MRKTLTINSGSSCVGHPHRPEHHFVVLHEWNTYLAANPIHVACGVITGKTERTVAICSQTEQCKYVARRV